MDKPRIVASIEARMGSSRFPGKMMADVNGKPALVRVIDRLKACERLDGIVLATTVDPKDDILEECAKTESIACHRGSEDDVLNRVVEAHRLMNTDIIVEVTGDCILLDKDVVGQGISVFLENDCDVVSNAGKTSFPQGADVQVFHFKDLDWVEQNITDSAVREHVSLYFYENPDKYRIIHLIAPPRWHAPDQRLQLDYEEDLAFIKAVYEKLEPVYGPVDFGVQEILALLKKHPEIRRINAGCTNKPVRAKSGEAA